MYFKAGRGFEESLPYASVCGLLVLCCVVSGCSTCLNARRMCVYQCIESVHSQVRQQRI